eukprot:jgi/Mesen1/2006/ME000147S01095
MDKKKLKVILKLPKPLKRSHEDESSDGPSCSDSRNGLRSMLEYSNEAQLSPSSAPPKKRKLTTFAREIPSPAQSSGSRELLAWGSPLSQGITKRPRKPKVTLDPHISPAKPPKGPLVKPHKNYASSTQGSLLGLKISMEAVLDKLQKKDVYNVFAEPVKAEQVPDYYDVIKDPMDFLTMRKRINAGHYTSWEQFKMDILLVCGNAMRYNAPGTFYFRQAKLLQDASKKAIEAAQSGEPEKPRGKRGRKPKAWSLPADKRSKPESQDRLQLDVADGISVQYDHSGRIGSWDDTTGIDGEESTGGAPLYSLDTLVVKASKVASLQQKLAKTAGQSGLAKGKSSWGGARVKSKVGDVDSDRRSLGKANVQLNTAGPARVAEGRHEVEQVQQHSKTELGGSSRAHAQRDGLKDGRRPLLPKDNRRTTYRPKRLPGLGYGPSPTAGGEHRHVVPTGWLPEHAYARSLALFAASFGPTGWRMAAATIRGVLPTEVEFGPGWVGEPPADQIPGDGGICSVPVKAQAAGAAPATPQLLPAASHQAVQSQLQVPVPYGSQNVATPQINDGDGDTDQTPILTGLAGLSYLQEAGRAGCGRQDRSEIVAKGMGYSSRQASRVPGAGGEGLHQAGKMEGLPGSYSMPGPSLNSPPPSIMTRLPGPTTLVTDPPASTARVPSPQYSSGHGGSASGLRVAGPSQSGHDLTSGALHPPQPGAMSAPLCDASDTGTETTSSKGPFCASSTYLSPPPSGHPPRAALKSPPFVPTSATQQGHGAGVAPSLASLTAGHREHHSGQESHSAGPSPSKELPPRAEGTRDDIHRTTPPKDFKSPVRATSTDDAQTRYGKQARAGHMASGEGGVAPPFTIPPYGAVHSWMGGPAARDLPPEALRATMFPYVPQLPSSGSRFSSASGAHHQSLDAWGKGSTLRPALDPQAGLVARTQELGSSALGQGPNQQVMGGGSFYSGASSSYQQQPSVVSQAQSVPSIWRPQVIASKSTGSRSLSAGFHADLKAENSHQLGSGPALQTGASLHGVEQQQLEQISNQHKSSTLDVHRPFLDLNDLAQADD